MKRNVLVWAMGVASLAAPVFGQSAAAKPPESKGGEREIDKSAAYYHYALGHLYAELAGAYGNRGDYLSRAIENYRLAMKADPTAGFLAEELSDLYIQSGRIRDAVNEAEEAIKQNPNDLGSRRVLARIYTRMIGDAQQNRIDDNMVRKSIEQYQKIVELAPADTEAWLMLGRLQKVAQNSPEAEKAYKRVLDREPDNEDALTGLAMVYSDLGDSKQATELLRRAAEKNPSARSLSVLASAYEQMKDYSLAAETLKRAIQMGAPNAADLKRAMGQNLLFADRIDEAIQVYEELVAEDPKDTQSWLRLSQAHRQQREFAKARQAAEKAVALDPNNIEIRYNEVSLLEAEERYPEAIAQMLEILNSTAKRNYSQGERANRAILLERLGILYRQNEKYADAVNTYRSIAELDKDMAPRALALIVDTYRLAKDYSKAEQEAEAAVKKYPDDRTLQAVRASLLADLGRADQAVAEMRKQLGGKNDRETYLTIAQLYEKGKKFDEMAKALDAAEKLSKTDDERENIHFMRGAMYEKMKRYDQSEAEFRKVLELNPDSAAALNYLGYTLADRNVRLNEALEMIQKAVEKEPTNSAYLDSLGWVYYRLGRYEEAEDYLKRSIARFSKDPTVHDHLGDVYLKQGKLKEAIEHWQISLKEWEMGAPADRDAAEIAKVQKKLESAKVRLAKESSNLTNKQEP
jgi:tetratricopeptide (TPR) repeat protein